MVTLYKRSQQMTNLRIRSINDKRGLSESHVSVPAQSFDLINALNFVEMRCFSSILLNMW